MTDADARPPLRDVIRRHGLGAERRLGQHFLLDRNLTNKIAGAATGLDAASVIEIGPGPGGLTRALLDAGAREVVAVELDSRCVPALEELAGESGGRLRVIEGDALTMDLAELAPPPWRIVANLPYNVATPLLLKWLYAADQVEEMVLTFQKEVAARLTAKPRSKAYGRLSVIAQRQMEVTHLFDIGPKAFVPPPKVSSTVLRLRPRPQPLTPDALAWLARTTRAAFGQRRKMLRASLQSLGVETEALIREAGVPPTARAEELTVEAFCTLARTLAERNG
ncbi:MAG: 16S rRNA (adenine(1518)-N(6)/adenine(1519)-N(6))-dimethyltransferase RsmA [Alphaproteobacteria bacterium]|nr:16S rRNA (adenine(1518)-N(6)/adenine(1519)-N(6))-dimethyltransferase RsmA [Alphaproteobacteria bacterium]